MANVYTEEQTLELVNAYSAAESATERDSVVEDFAERYDRSVASIRGKLTREGVYVSKAKEKTTTTRGMRKAEIVHAIATMLGLRQDLESLNKATVNDLRLILDGLKNLNNQFELARGE